MIGKARVQTHASLAPESPLNQDAPPSPAWKWLSLGLPSFSILHPFPNKAPFRLQWSQLGSPRQLRTLLFLPLLGFSCHGTFSSPHSPRTLRPFTASSTQRGAGESAAGPWKEHCDRTTPPLPRLLRRKENRGGCSPCAQTLTLVPWNVLPPNSASVGRCQRPRALVVGRDTSNQSALLCHLAAS